MWVEKLEFGLMANITGRVKTMLKVVKLGLGFETINYKLRPLFSQSVIDQSLRLQLGYCSCI